MGNVRSWNALASAEQGAPISPLRAVATFLLVFQVCLRILWIDVMPRCHNCEIEHMPENALRKEAIGTSSLSAETGGSRKNHALQDFRCAPNHIRYPAEEWSRHFSAAGRTGGSASLADSHYWGRQRRAGDAAQWSVVSGRPEIKPSRSCNSELTAEAISI
jgi:hypothetical protein